MRNGEAGKIGKKMDLRLELNFVFFERFVAICFSLAESGLFGTC